MVEGMELHVSGSESSKCGPKIQNKNHGFCGV